ncbi:substrate-binding periplasmic protein [Aliiglaciecola sp. M165]|uniref:substrate-binding periplasmic protein n=1 Tax=Aliiglaciecola sp. M165 TaxID=2593649 RepID=UPI00117F437A|nr:transporter substrate-binding domain-containing protein [Aliiglaciecola sp. M165]TRY33711.1 transporter substrate-binding domain-containing protein [Aliiglaciecola sp. M165]
MIITVALRYGANFAAAVIGLGLLYSNHGRAAEQELIILTNPLPFFSESNRNGKPSGYSVELAKLIADQARMRYSISAMPWARIMAKKEGDVPIMILGLARTEAREEDFHWLTAISQNQVAAFANDPPQISLTSLKLLDEFGYIAVLRDDYRQQILIDNKVQNMVTFNSWEQAVKTLIRGRVDSVFLSDMGLALTCLQASLNCRSLKKVLTYQVTQSYIAMAKTKVNDVVADSLKTAAQMVKESEEFRLMAARYLSGREGLSKSLVLTNGMVEVKNEFP